MEAVGRDREDSDGHGEDGGKWLGLGSCYHTLLGFSINVIDGPIDG